MDIISIHALELWTRIGVPAEERRTEQRIVVSVRLRLDVREAAKTDDVRKSIDYDEAVRLLRTLAQTERKTIEAFAEDAATALLAGTAAQSVEVTVHKMVIPGTRSVSVTVLRP